MEKEKPSYTYAKRLMKQMGWTEGKGLGKNEDGIINFIPAIKKAGTRGIGFNYGNEQLEKDKKASSGLLNDLNGGHLVGRKRKLTGARPRAFELNGHVSTREQLDTTSNSRAALNRKRLTKSKKGDTKLETFSAEPSQEQSSCEQLGTASSNRQAALKKKLSRKKRRKGDTRLKSLAAELPHKEGQKMKPLRKKTNYHALENMSPKEAPSDGQKAELQSWQIGHDFLHGYRMPPVDYETAAAMACSVVDAVDKTTTGISPSTACYLSKEDYAELLANHINKRHRTTNWMQIPGYGSKLWWTKCVTLTLSSLRKKVQPESDSIFSSGGRTAVDYKTARAMARWVVDTADKTTTGISHNTACYLSKEDYAELLANHIYKRHRTTNWMQIPGYASELWQAKCVTFITSTLRKKVQLQRDSALSSEARSNNCSDASSVGR